MFQLGKSEKAFEEAKRYMPGGVNSPVRSYRSVGSNPPFISSASGRRVFDIVKNEKIHDTAVFMISIITNISTMC